MSAIRPSSSGPSSGRRSIPAHYARGPGAVISSADPGATVDAPRTRSLSSAALMNILVLPSWYGHRCHPLHGTFVLEQAAALADLRPAWNVALSYWGQGLGRISSDHLRESPRCLIDALRLPREDERALASNLREFRTRALSWNERWRHGNREGILAANRRTLARPRARFGSIAGLHAHVSYPAGWVAMKLSDETGIPYVITEHMGPFPIPVYRRAHGFPAG